MGEEVELVASRLREKGGRITQAAVIEELEQLRKHGVYAKVDVCAECWRWQSQKHTLHFRQKVRKFFC